MKKLELPPSLKLHNKIIDDEHQKLVDSINSVADACNKGELEESVRLLNDFFILVQTHFKHEEDILKEAQYPHVDEHVSYHKKLGDKSKWLMELCEAASENEAAKEKFLMELTLYLLEDALKADITFKSFLLSSV